MQDCGSDLQILRSLTGTSTSISRNDNPPGDDPDDPEDAQELSEACLGYIDLFIENGDFDKEEMLETIAADEELVFEEKEGLAMMIGVYESLEETQDLPSVEYPDFPEGDRYDDCARAYERQLITADRNYRDASIAAVLAAALPIPGAFATGIGLAVAATVIWRFHIKDAGEDYAACVRDAANEMEDSSDQDDPDDGELDDNDPGRK